MKVPLFVQVENVLALFCLSYLTSRLRPYHRTYPTIASASRTNIHSGSYPGRYLSADEKNTPLLGAHFSSSIALPSVNVPACSRLR